MRTLLLVALVGLMIAPLAVPTAAATSCVDDLGGLGCFVILAVLCAGEAIDPANVKVIGKELLSCVLA